MRSQSPAETSVNAAGNNGPVQMYKPTASNTFRVQQIADRQRQNGRLDMSQFNKVLTINTTEQFAEVGGSTTFETFVRETSKVGFIPLVVPELKTITVGGAIVGLGVESTSFRYGLVHEGMLQAEVLLSSGEVVKCNATENADLFDALPNSLGSFGYLLSVRMRIRPMRPIVELQKQWFGSPEDLVQALQAQSDSSLPVDFVEAVAFGRVGGMLLTGRMVDCTPTPAIPLSHYRTTQRFYATLSKEGVDYLPTVDYLWRWDTDWFWLSQIFPGLRTPCVRWLLGERYLRSDVYKKFNDFVIKTLGQPKDQELVIQDFEIPVAKCVEWIDYHFKTVPLGKVTLRAPDGRSHPPMWLCPVKGHQQTLVPMKEGSLYINCGFWDAVTVPKTMLLPGTNTIFNRQLEAECLQMGGMKTLYSSVHLSAEDFWKNYNGAEYQKLKAKYDPTGRFRDLYQKVTK